MEEALAMLRPPEPECDCVPTCTFRALPTNAPRCARGDPDERKMSITQMHAVQVRLRVFFLFLGI